MGCGVVDEEPDAWATGTLRAGRGLLLVDGIDGSRRRNPPAPGRGSAIRSPATRPTAGCDLPQLHGRRGPTGRQRLPELALAAMNSTEVATFIGRRRSVGELRTTRPGHVPEKRREDVRTRPAPGRLTVNYLMYVLICAPGTSTTANWRTAAGSCRRWPSPHSSYAATGGRDLAVPEVSEVCEVSRRGKLAPKSSNASSPTAPNSPANTRSSPSARLWAPSPN